MEENTPVKACSIITDYMVIYRKMTRTLVIILHLIVKIVATQAGLFHTRALEKHFTVSV